MKKEISLFDVINDDAFDEIEIQIGYNTFQSIVNIDKKNEIKSILAGNLLLTYIPGSFKEPNEKYFSYQAAAHKTYYDWVYNEFLAMHSAMREVIDANEQLGIRESKYGILFQTRLFLNRIANEPKMLWQYHNTCKGILVDMITSSVNDFEQYTLVESVINYGKNLLDTNISKYNGDISDEARNNLIQWHEIQKKISFTHHQIAFAAKEILEGQKIAFYQTFPNSRLVL